MNKKKLKDIVVKKIEKYYWEKQRSIFNRFKQDDGIEDLAEKYERLTSALAGNQSKSELFFIYTIANKTLGLLGSVAEIGVWEGLSAKVIAEVEGKKPIHLFDTFAGFPWKTERYEKGYLNQDFNKTLNTFKPHANVVFHKGIFPKTLEELDPSETFSFVHFDIDLYQETLDGLKYFYPRTVKGGCYVFHDYRFLPGVKKAVDEFFSDKAEIVLPLFGSQAFVQKLG